MSTQRKPLVGWTYDAEVSPTGSHAIFDFNGDRILNASADEIGIPAPRPPRTGTLGLSEEDTRKRADLWLYVSPRSASEREWSAVITMHRADVARWDAEDEAAANAEPETLTLENVPLAAVRLAVKWWSCFPEGDLVRAFADRSSAALENAGLS